MFFVLKPYRPYMPYKFPKLLKINIKKAARGQPF